MTTSPAPAALRTVAFIGLGIMGGPMAAHLLDAGFALRIYNRTAAKAAPLVERGAVACATPREAAAGADAVVTMVTDTPDVEAVLFGPDGAVHGARPGALVIDMSTIAPEGARSLAARLRALGLAPLDAPVTGGDVGARDGTLTVMVGGDEADFTRAAPLFAALGRRTVHVGPSGAGQTVKAANQILCAVHTMAACEALAFARAAGVDVARLLEVVTTGAGGSWVLTHLAPRLAAGDLAPGFMVELLQKDLAIVDRTARDAELPLPATALATQLFRATAAAGGERLGTQALGLAYEALTGRRIREG